VLTAVTVHLTTNFLNALLSPTGSDSGCLTNSPQSTHVYFAFEFCLRFGPDSDAENGTFFILVPPSWGEWSDMLRGTQVAPYAITVAPHFLWARHKTASKITKQWCSTSATRIPIMTIHTVVINLSHHQYHVVAPVLLSGHFE